MSEAFRKGETVGKRRGRPCSNPYKHGTIEHYQWSCGYDAGWETAFLILMDASKRRQKHAAA